MQYFQLAEIFKIRPTRIKGHHATFNQDVLCYPVRDFDMMSYFDPCTHEEADNRLMVHVADAVARGHNSIMIRSVDTDVVVFAQFRNWQEPEIFTSNYLLSLSYLGIERSLSQCFIHSLGAILFHSSMEKVRRENISEELTSSVLLIETPGLGEQCRSSPMFVQKKKEKSATFFVISTSFKNLWMNWFV